MIQVTLVGSGSTARLPEILARPGVRITVIGNRQHALAGSRYVDEWIHLGHHGVDDLADALLAHPSVIDRLRGWITFGEDTTPYRLARSSLPLADKVRILPARTPSGRDSLGSKVGLVRLADEAGVRQPASTIIDRPSDLAHAVSGMPFPLVAKSDLGAGGVRVVRLADPCELTAASLPPEWYPLVLQEFVPGIDVSVEALFRDGRLVAWLYSRTLRTAGPNGPSTERLYLDPPDSDALDSLDRLARAGGLHGLFNCSFRWSPRTRLHYLYEADARPNAWHQFGPAMGVDWVAHMADTGARPSHGPDHGPGGRPLRLYPRELIWGVDEGDWPAIRPWLTFAPGTWRDRNHKDSRVNKADRRALAQSAQRAARFAVARTLTSTRNALPTPVRGAIDRSGVTGGLRAAFRVR